MILDATHAFILEEIISVRTDSDGKVPGAEHCLPDSRKFKKITFLNLGLCNFMSEYGVSLDMSYLSPRAVLSFAFCRVTRRQFFF
jgi:hypothetical protein